MAPTGGSSVSPPMDRASNERRHKREQNAEQGGYAEQRRSVGSLFSARARQQYRPRRRSTHAAPATPTISPESGLVRSVIIRVMAAAKAMAAAQNSGIAQRPQRFLGQQCCAVRGRNGSCASSFQGVFRCRILPSAGFASRRGSVSRRRAASSPGPLPRRRRFAKRWRLLGEALHVPAMHQPFARRRASRSTRWTTQQRRLRGRPWAKAPTTMHSGGACDKRGQHRWRRLVAEPCRSAYTARAHSIKKHAGAHIPAPDAPAHAERRAKQRGRRQGGRSQATAARRMLRARHAACLQGPGPLCRATDAASLAWTSAPSDQQCQP